MKNIIALICLLFFFGCNKNDEPKVPQNDEVSRKEAEASLNERIRKSVDLSKIMMVSHDGMNVNACFEMDKYSFYMEVIASRNPNFKIALEKSFNNKLSLDEIKKLYDETNQLHVKWGLVTQERINAIKIMEASILSEANFKAQQNKFQEYMDYNIALWSKYSIVCNSYIQSLH